MNTAASSAPSNAQNATSADTTNDDLELQTPIIRRSKKVTFSKLRSDRLKTSLSIVVTFSRAMKPKGERKLCLLHGTFIFPP